MKRKVLLLLMLLLPLGKATECIGQTLPNIYKNGTNGLDNKIEYDPATGNHILYSVHSNENHFSLTDITNTTIDVRVSTGYTINDFEIFENYVFFCGSSFTGEGMIGWFDINDLFYGGLPAYFDHTLADAGLSSLYDIEVYRDVKNLIHIAGLGRTTTSSYRDAGFEAIGDPLTGMQYRIGQFHHPVSDLAVTDNYVVYVGNYSSAGLVLYPFEKNDIFGSMYHPSFFYQTVFVTGEIDPLYLDNTEVIHIGNDHVATINHRTEDSNRFNSIVLRTYSIAGMGITCSAIMQNAYKMILPFNFGLIREFKYDPMLQTYYILHSFYLTPGVSTFALAPIDLSGSVPATIPNYYCSTTNIPMTDLCLKNSPFYTICGYDPVSYATYYWQGRYPSATNICVRQEPLDFKTHYIVDEKDIDRGPICSGMYNLTFNNELRDPDETNYSYIMCKDE